MDWVEGESRDQHSLRYSCVHATPGRAVISTGKNTHLARRDDVVLIVGIDHDIMISEICGTGWPARSVQIDPRVCAHAHGSSLIDAGSAGEIGYLRVRRMNRDIVDPPDLAQVAGNIGPMSIGPEVRIGGDPDASTEGDGIDYGRITWSFGSHANGVPPFVRLIWVSQRHSNRRPGVALIETLNHMLAGSA